MKVLYIDTSSSYLYTAIVENGRSVIEIKKDFGHDLSEKALPEIVSMFESINLKPEEIDKIIVVNGPGSFTGIRIGITIAKVYAWSLNIPITTITSLEAMMLSSNKNMYKVPVIDARRKYVFGAIYDNDNKEIIKPQYVNISNLEKELEKINNYTVITNDDIYELNNKESYNPNISKIVEYFKDKPPINPHAINPNYLKLTEAEESIMQ